METNFTSPAPERERFGDITGMRFGHLTVVRYDHYANGRGYYLCRCDCGKDALVSRSNLTTGKTRSCGHLKSTSIRMRRGGYHKVTLTERQVKWLLSHYRNTKNDEIKRKLGITDGYLHRFARIHGLKKTPQFLHKCQRTATAAANRSHMENGTYPPKGFRIPNSDKGCFQKGVTSEMRLGKRKNARRIRRSAESRRRTFAEEKARAAFGMERKTRLNVIKQPRKTYSQRMQLKRRGYLVTRGSFDVLYNENTQRSPLLEKRYTRFRFHPSK